jgi:hypothetical protein
MRRPAFFLLPKAINSRGETPMKKTWRFVAAARVFVAAGSVRLFQNDPAADGRPALLDVLALLGPEGGHRLGVAFFEGAGQTPRRF